jgi:hypothetical protein
VQVYLNMSNNRLSGPIPEELAASPVLSSSMQVLLPSG